MPVEKFDETSMVNGPVPKSGTEATAQPPDPPKATGLPKAVETADGTENLRANSETKQAALPSTPSGGKQRWPSAVESFDGEKV